LNIAFYPHIFVKLLKRLAPGRTAGGIKKNGVSMIFCNHSAAIHQDGEKPVLFVPFFFRELLGFSPLKQRHTE
jgi:hypothetical protein